MNATRRSDQQIEGKVFFLNDTETTEIYTLSRHDALPIFRPRRGEGRLPERRPRRGHGGLVLRQRHRHERHVQPLDRKSTRLNSSHANISYAVFCLKKKHISWSHRARCSSTSTRLYSVYST